MNSAIFSQSIQTNGARIKVSLSNGNSNHLQMLSSSEGLGRELYVSRVKS